MEKIHTISPKDSIRVYVTDMATFYVPKDVESRANELNAHLAGDRLNDMRTRGAKWLKAWAESQPVNHYPLNMANN